MVVTHFGLHPGFSVHDVEDWYRVATVGDAVSIAIPSRDCILRLLWRDKNRVGWWPEGGRSVTMSVEEAMHRLQMLCDPKPADA